MRALALAILFMMLSTGTLFARVGDPVAAFANGPLIQQLSLNAAGGNRFVSDDQMITVDLVVQGGKIEQQVMYIPASIQRAYQVIFFLQDAVGSVLGAQQGMVAFNTAMSNHTETSMAFGEYVMRFAPMDSVMRVTVGRR